MKVRFVFGLALVAGLLAPGFLGEPARAQDPGHILYQLIIDCPQARQATAGVAIRCPVRAEDPQDMMGSPSVAVDIRNPNLVVLASLHALDGDGPSQRSRAGSFPFTTFASTDGGRTWKDNFFPGPIEMRGAFGEHPQIVTDPYGHVYVGSLYAKPAGPGLYAYILSAQKFENLAKVNQYQQHRGSQNQGGTYNAQFVDTFYRFNAMSQYWYVFNPRTDNMSVMWHEGPPVAAPQNAEARAWEQKVLEDDGYRRSLLDIKPATYVPQNPGGRPKDRPPFSFSVISFAWSNTTMKANYSYAREDQLIGPCSTSTNPVWSEGFIYVGCVADPVQGPFKWNPKTVKGQVELFRLIPESGFPPQYLGPAPISSGMPKLGVRSDGRLALFSAGMTDLGRVQLLGAFGAYKDGYIEWTSVKDYASKIPSLPIGQVVLAANIQDLEYREYSGAVHVILKEEIQFLPVEGLDIIPSLLPKYRKNLIAIDERWGYLTHYPLDIGRPENRTDPLLLRQAEENYDDLADDIVQHPPRPYNYKDYEFDQNYQREFIAVGDYGIIIFAEVIEITTLRPPGVPPTPPGPPPVAAPALATTPSAVLVPLAGSSFAGLLAFALVASRRKTLVAAFVKGE